jgi:DNA-directed RNA polymerase specialized sigma24 family protein
LRPGTREPKIKAVNRWNGAWEGPSLSSDGSVTNQIGKLKAGDPDAARLLWQRYFQRLVRLARRKLQPNARRAADEEDVALTAFARFCCHAEQGRLPKVRDRDDLWRLLVTLTIRMAIDLIRREGRQKRCGSPPGDPTAVVSARDVAGRADADQLVDQQATPEFVAQVAEECERLLGALGDAELKSIAVWKTEGYTNEEIAAKLGVVLRTVERKLHAIRQRWSDDANAAPRAANEKH